MFKRQYRFPAQTRLNQPNSHISESFILKYAKNNLPYSRFGFVISKKIDKRSVKRNQTKRKFRSHLEGMQPRIKNGYDMLFILRKSIKDKPIAEMRQEIELEMTKKGLVSL